MLVKETLQFVGSFAQVLVPLCLKELQALNCDLAVVIFFKLLGDNKALVEVGIINSASDSYFYWLGRVHFV